MTATATDEFTAEPTELPSGKNEPRDQDNDWEPAGGPLRNFVRGVAEGRGIHILLA